MKSINKPQYDAWDNFLECAKNTKLKETREKLLKCKNFIESTSLNYNNAGRNLEFYRLSKSTGAPASDDELGKLYKDKLLGGDGPGRRLYQKIKHSASGGICPLCAVRIVTTLDHYMPQKSFPEFAILPSNLLPSCFECNTKKKSHIPKTSAEQILHPYFDKLDGSRWLYAKIRYSGLSPVLTFDVSTPSHWDAVTKSRLEFHFAKLNVQDTYSIHAGVEINGQREMLKKILSVGGKDEVAKFLLEQFSSWSSADVNSWQAATFDCLASCDQFCSGDFGELPH